MIRNISHAGRLRILFPAPMMPYFLGCYLIYLVAFSVSSAQLSRTNFEVRPIRGEYNFRTFFHKMFLFDLDHCFFFFLKIVKHRLDHARLFSKQCYCFTASIHF